MASEAEEKKNVLREILPDNPDFNGQDVLQDARWNWEKPPGGRLLGMVRQELGITSTSTSTSTSRPPIRTGPPAPAQVAAPAPVQAPAENIPITYSDLLAAREFLGRVGGQDRAEAAIEALRKLTED